TDVGRPFCQEYKRIMHPHLPDSAPLQADGLERLGFRKPSEAASMAAALRARLASAEETEQAPPDKQAQQ
ncbi:MAG: hypothetical protein N2036_10765, partial [Bryobacteraceae bacterium]|nr:hypothetical protein [Bryobacteraceae bacterium]